jgi:hypothetical protein
MGGFQGQGGAHEAVLLRFASHVLEDAVLPEALDEVPVLDLAVLNRALHHPRLLELALHNRVKPVLATGGAWAWASLHFTCASASSPIKKSRSSTPPGCARPDGPDAPFARGRTHAIAS